MSDPSSADRRALLERLRHLVETVHDPEKLGREALRAMRDAGTDWTALLQPLCPKRYGFNLSLYGQRERRQWLGDIFELRHLATPAELAVVAVLAAKSPPEGPDRWTDDEVRQIGDIGVALFERKAADREAEPVRLPVYPDLPWPLRARSTK